MKRNRAFIEFEYPRVQYILEAPSTLLLRTFFHLALTLEGRNFFYGVEPI